MVLAIIILGVKVSQTANLSISLVELINIGDLKQSRVKSENVSFPISLICGSNLHSLSLLMAYFAIAMVGKSYFLN